MGHYDSDYEHDEREREKKKKKRLQERLAELQGFRAELLGEQVPQRIKDAIDQIHDWLVVQIR